MHAVILTIHSLIVLALIGIVLMQRSEGGALGMGGGGGGGGFMTGRGTANLLTRTTSILAALFFSTSLGLAIMAETGEDEDRVIEELTRSSDDGAETEPLAPGSISTDDLLGTLGADEETPAAPAVEEPAADPAEDPAAGLLDVDEAATGLEESAGEAAEAAGDAADDAAAVVDEAAEETEPQE